MRGLTGRVAIVTGASRGIGAATAEALARQGAAVVLAARNSDACMQRAARLAAEGRTALGLWCDVADPASARAMVEAAEARFGPVGILVNNAGIIAPIARIADCDPSEWARSIEVNLIGAFHCVRAVLPGMKAAGAGTIINVSSGAAYRPFEGWSAYCAGKSGLAMLTRMIDHEYRDYGVRAFGFTPGLVDTGMQGAIRSSGLTEIKRSDLHPPDLPARAIAWLCSDDGADLAGRDIDLRDPDLRWRWDDMDQRKQ